MLSSNPQPQGDDLQCSHPGARRWIEQYLKKHGGCANIYEISKARPSLSDRDSSCRCNVIELLRSANCKKEFLIKEKEVCLMSSYESGLRKMESLLKERGPFTISKLLKELSKILTEGERVALAINREELKSTICRESAIFTRESATGLVVLRGVHSVLDPSCCHSGVIHWIEQYLKEHAGWAAISEMDLVRSELLASKRSCKCAIRSLLVLPSIRKHFHVKGSNVFTRSYYLSGLQKMTDILEKNGPQKFDELLHMLKETEVLSQTELGALGNNTADLEETVFLEPRLFKPVTRSGTVHFADSVLHPCRHHGMIKWIMKTLKKHSGSISIEELKAVKAKIRAQDGVCNCDISTILLDDKRSFQVQGNQVSLWSSRSSSYESGIKKIEAFLQKNGSQPVGILLNMLTQAKALTSEELKVIGRNKKELSSTITREPKVFKFVSPPGFVMLRNTHHEDSNQITKLVDYLEKYLRTCRTSYVKTLLKEVVRHESLSTGCISGPNSLRKLLAAYPDRFLILGDGSISLTKSRRMALSDSPKSRASMRKGIYDNESRISVNEISIGQCTEEVTQKGAHSSSTKDMSSSSSKPLDIPDRNNNHEANSSHKQRESTHKTCQSESSRDLNRALRFVEKHLETNGPMVVKHILASIVATTKLDKHAQRTLGRTPEELLSILLLQKDSFHVIPPNDLVVLCQTSQIRVNPWTTGLEKVQEYLRKDHPLGDLVGFIRKNLTPKELQAFGDSKKQVKRTLAFYQDIFENRSGIISLRSADRKLASKGRKKRKQKRTSKDARVNQNEGMEDGKERMDDVNPCKRQKTKPQVQTAVNPVVVLVVETAEEWLRLCHPLFDSVSSVVGIDCDSKWFVLRQWDGKVIATKIHVPSSSPPPPAMSASSNQEPAVAESLANAREHAGVSNKPGDIFNLLSLLLTSPSILKVVYDVQRICAVLCQKMPVSIDNVFDIKIANQLLRRVTPSHLVPDRISFTDLCEMYSVVPSAVIHVSCSTPGGVDGQDVAILKNMAVMTCTLIPHFLHKMFRDMKLELLTEHNCIVDELIKAWGTGFNSGRRFPKDFNMPSDQEQVMPMTSMQVPNPDHANPRVLHGILHNALDSGLQPGRNLPKDRNVPSVQEQRVSLNSMQVPNHDHVDPRLACNSGRYFPKDCNVPSHQEQVKPLTSMQVPNPDTTNPLVLRGIFRNALDLGLQPGRHLPKDPDVPSVQEQRVSLTTLQVPNHDHVDPRLACNYERHFPKDCNVPSHQEEVKPLTSMQVPYPDSTNPLVLRGIFCNALDLGLQPGRNLPKDPDVPSVQEQRVSLTSLQVPNHDHIDPSLTCNYGKQFPKDCNVPSDQEQVKPLTSMQVPNPDSTNPLVLRGIFRNALD